MRHLLLDYKYCPQGSYLLGHPRLYFLRHANINKKLNSKIQKINTNGNKFSLIDISGNQKEYDKIIGTDELKKRKDIKPVGFAIDDTTLYLTNSDGKMILADLSIGNIKTIEKVSGDFVSRPFIFNQNLFVIRNGSIVQYN